jgi:hypothetical protein
VQDVWSRRIVGFAVHEEQSMELAARLVRATCATACVETWPLAAALRRE